MRTDPKIIGITGKAGSGKDTVANMILARIPEAVTYSWATPLKEFAEAVFHFPHSWLWADSELRNRVMIHPNPSAYWRETADRFWRLGGEFSREWLAACNKTPAGHPIGSAFVDWFDAIRHECEKDHGKLTPRHVLQQLGTEFGRKVIDQDVWIQVGMGRIRNLKTPLVVIPDVRFDNESGPILMSGGEVWRVLGRGVYTVTLQDLHESETGVSPKYVRRTLPNFGSLEQLRSEVNDCLYMMGLT